MRRGRRGAGSGAGKTDPRPDPPIHRGRGRGLSPGARSRRLGPACCALYDVTTMKLEGIHHITCITADAQMNVDFYARLLGLRMVKKTVNQDDPSVYHLFYADEQGSPGADLTFFEYPGAAPGRPGAGMVHRIAWRVASDEAIDFWEQRLKDRDVAATSVDGALRFADPEGLEHELRVVETEDAPLIADHPEVPAQVALQGFDEARAYAARPDASEDLLEALGFDRRGEGWEVRG